jgi:aminopeptidase
MNDYNEKAAVLAVRYAIGVKPEDKVAIMGSAVANDLMKAIYIETIKVGGFPMIMSRIPGVGTSLYRYGNDEQIKFISPLVKVLYQEYDALINVFGAENRQSMALIDPAKLKMAQTTPESIELMGIYKKRVAEGKLQWTIVPLPCDAFAQDAKMDTDAYSDFVYNALHLDAEDPAEYWKGIEKQQDTIVQYLNGVENIQVMGEDTDLTLSVKDRPWNNSCGHRNLPDGEVFTSPIETSINGHIRFTYPGIYQGKEIENIYLEFKDGKVVKGTAAKGQELLDSVLSIKNADKVGEFAIGTNYGIDKFTKNMLFDEKMGGTMHMALGRGFPQTKSENMECVIHWDILKDLKSEDSKIIADGKIIYQAGKWLI